jgi:hypothetical protein
VENLREAGCDDAGIESITGMSQAMIRRYSRFADQKKLAKAAVLRLRRNGPRTGDWKTWPRLENVFL